MAAGEGDGRRPEALGDDRSRTAGQLAVRFGSGANDDPGRGRAQGIEIELVVGDRDDVLADEGSFREPSSSVGSPNIAGSGAGWS
ncbi:MAG TPA: hypothetical protein VFY18_07095, partial [Candidatus Limnocylindrales bacterium]|nr:hypothetical protein [Candidatus Limnocylindrales bacterium]